MLREELGADRDVFASMLLLEPSAVVEGCAHDLQKRVTRLVEVRGSSLGAQGCRGAGALGWGACICASIGARAAVLCVS